MEPDTIKIDREIQILSEHCTPKRNTYHSRSRQNKKRNNFRKNCDFKGMKQEDLLISKNITSKTKKNTSGKAFPRKSPEIEDNRTTHHPKQLRPTTQTIHYTTRTRKRRRNEIRTNPNNSY